MAKFSPSSKFIAIATKSTEIKLWEICEDKNGRFTEIQKAISGHSIDLHKKTITWLDFTQDSNFLLSCSLDCTWKVWDIDVKYKLNEDSKCVLTAKEPNSLPFQFITVSPNSQAVATVSGDVNIILWDFKTGKIIDTIEKAHDAPITALSWSRNSDMLVSSSEDTRVHLWKLK